MNRFVLKNHIFRLETLFILALGFILVTKFSFADTVNTSVTVGNSAPVISGNVAENPTSDDTTPTDVDTNVTFQATANDSNNEDWYLIVCKTSAVTPVNGGAPTCTVDEWCTSTATASGSQASCNYGVTDANEPLESYDWYAFACDGNAAGALCSPVDTGTGGSGSPFKVNHKPTFNAISNDGPKDPGQNITWSTDASTLDDDISGTADTVKLVVCKTAGITGDACDGGASDQWCASSFVASNPSCSYLLPVPTVSGTPDAYVYLVDSHNLGASSVNQGYNSTYTVNNIAPVVSNVVINSGNDIDLTEGTTYGVVVTADITDNNGCGGGEISTVTSNLYRSGVTAAGCDSNGEDDYDYCYAIETCSETSCVGAGASYSCTINVQYHADPTDTGTEFPTEKWYDTVLATDQYALSHSYENNTGVIMNSLTALDVTSLINYGNLYVGTNTGNLDQLTTTTATGNVGLDQELSGTDMDDGNSHTIAVAQQKYDLTAILYSLAASLSGTPANVEINVPKTRTAGVGEDDTYWGIEIPVGTVSGVYTGTNTVTAIKGEVLEW